MLRAEKAAEELGVSVHVFRKWIWKLDMEPAERKPMDFPTAHGRRVGVVALYSSEQIQRVRKAMKS